MQACEARCRLSSPPRHGHGQHWRGPRPTGVAGSWWPSTRTRASPANPSLPATALHEVGEVHQRARQPVQLGDDQHLRTEENFGYTFDRRFEGLVIDRHDANGEMLRRFLDQPEFASTFTAWARGETFRQIREQAGGASSTATSSP